MVFDTPNLWFSRCGAWASSVSIWDRVRNTHSQPLSRIRSSGEGPHKLFEQALQIILVLRLENHTVKQLLNKHYEDEVHMSKCKEVYRIYKYKTLFPKLLISLRKQDQCT